MEEGLIVKNLSVLRDDKEILRDLSFAVGPGELLVIEGPNGVGKSTLVLTMFGYPSCKVVSGAMTLDGHDLVSLAPHERARRGLFLAHQEPAKIPGITIAEALRASCEALQGQHFSIPKFYDQLRVGLQRLGLSDDFAQRSLNEQLSGGEKKRGELLALLLAKPRVALLDEIDSGMDAVARALARDVIAELRSIGTGFLVITHNAQFIDEIGATRRLLLSPAVKK